MKQCWIKLITLFLLTPNANVAIVLNSVTVSFYTVNSEGRQMKQCWIKHITLFLLTANANVAIVRDSVTASFHTVKIWGAADEAGLNQAIVSIDCQCKCYNSPRFNPSVLPHFKNLRGGRWSSVEWARNIVSTTCKIVKWHTRVSVSLKLDRRCMVRVR